MDVGSLLQGSCDKLDAIDLDNVEELVSWPPSYNSPLPSTAPSESFLTPSLYSYSDSGYGSKVQPPTIVPADHDAIGTRLFRHEIAVRRAKEAEKSARGRCLLSIASQTCRSPGPY